MDTPSAGIRGRHRVARQDNSEVKVALTPYRSGPIFRSRLAAEPLWIHRPLPRICRNGSSAVCKEAASAPYPLRQRCSARSSRACSRQTRAGCPGPSEIRRTTNCLNPGIGRASTPAARVLNSPFRATSAYAMIRRLWGSHAVGPGEKRWHRGLGGRFGDLQPAPNAMPGTPGTDIAWVAARRTAAGRYHCEEVPWRAHPTPARCCCLAELPW